MNKTELVAAMAAKANVSKKDTEAVLNAFIETVQEAVKADDKVQLVGFGTFEARERAAREGINPLTKEKIRLLLLKLPRSRQVKHLRICLNNLISNSYM